MAPPTDPTLTHCATPVFQRGAHPPSGVSDGYEEQVVTWFRSILHFWVKTFPTAGVTESRYLRNVPADVEPSDYDRSTKHTHSNCVPHGREIVRGQNRKHSHREFMNDFDIRSSDDVTTRTEADGCFFLATGSVEPNRSRSASRSDAEMLQLNLFGNQATHVWSSEMGPLPSEEHAETFQSPSVYSATRSEKGIPAWLTQSPHSDTVASHQKSNSCDGKVRLASIERYRSCEVIDGGETSVKSSLVLNRETWRSAKAGQSAVTTAATDRGMTANQLRCPQLLKRSTACRVDRAASRDTCQFWSPAPPSSVLTSSHNDCNTIAFTACPQRPGPVLLTAVSVLIKYIGKDYDLNGQRCGAKDLTTSSMADLTFPTAVSLGHSSHRVFPPTPDCSQPLRSQPFCFKSMMLVQVSDAVTVVTMPRVEERSVESSLQYKDTHRYKNSVDVSPALAAVGHADTMVVYGRNSTKQRHVNTVFYKPKFRVRKTSDTRYVFPANKTHSFVSVLDYPLHQRRKWFKTQMELKPVASTAQSISTSSSTTPKWFPDVIRNSSGGVISNGCNDVICDGAGSSQVFIPCYRSEGPVFEEKQFRIRLQNRNQDKNSSG